jgi:AraC-like DNA-binding protein
MTIESVSPPNAGAPAFASVDPATGKVIEEHIAEPVSARHLAEAVHTSPFHFARMFGSTPRTYRLASMAARDGR